MKKVRIFVRVDEEVKEWANSQERGWISREIERHLRTMMDAELEMDKAKRYHDTILERKQKRSEEEKRLKAREKQKANKRVETGLKLLEKTPDTATALRAFKMGVTIKDIRNIVSKEVYKDFRKRRTTNGK